MNAMSSHAAEIALAPTVAGRDPCPAIDRLGVHRAVRELLLALDADVDSAGLKDTPRRVADAYVAARPPEGWGPDCDLVAAWRDPRRCPHPPGILGASSRTTMMWSTSPASPRSMSTPVWPCSSQAKSSSIRSSCS